MSKKEIIYLQGMTCVSCEVLIADELKEIGEELEEKRL